MTEKELLKKLEVVQRVVKKLPKKADYQLAQAEDGGMEIVLNDYLGIGVRDAARALGRDVERRNLIASLWEISFVVDGVRISQLSREPHTVSHAEDH